MTSLTFDRSRYVPVVALTTRQKLKEHFSSSRREAVRPLVVKQTEYPNREKTARCGKSSKIFLFSVRTILLFRWLLPSKTTVPDPSCASCSRSEESTHRSQPGCKGTTVCDSTTQTRAMFGQRCGGFKVIWRERSSWNWLLLLRGEGGDGYLCYSKNPINRSINQSVNVKNISISQLHGPFRKFTA